MFDDFQPGATFANIRPASDSKAINNIRNILYRRFNVTLAYPYIIQCDDIHRRMHRLCHAQLKKSTKDAQAHTDTSMDSHEGIFPGYSQTATEAVL